MNVVENKKFKSTLIFHVVISKSKDMSMWIANFHEQIKKGPYFICIEFNRCLYKKSVIAFSEERYNFEADYFYFAQVMMAMSIYVELVILN